MHASTQSVISLIVDKMVGKTILVDISNKQWGEICSYVNNLSVKSFLFSSEFDLDLAIVVFLVVALWILNSVLDRAEKRQQACAAPAQC